MLKFKKPRIKLEVYGKKILGKSERKPIIPDDILILCPECKETMFRDEMNENLKVCLNCGYNFLLTPYERIQIIADEASFVELDKDLKVNNPINFPNYENKLNTIRDKTSMTESVVTGSCTINGIETYIFVMDAHFMMGSMGIATGEKITRLFERATQNSMPVVGFTASGGARMQEGIFSLMQMVKTSGSVKKHSDNGNLYVTVLTNPTTGGVTASFAMEGDIILSEPQALIGFAGPRVIEQTIKQKLPKGFQRAEMLLEKGFVDAIVKRNEQKEYLGKILRLHKKGGF